MTKRILLAALLGGLAMFAAGAFSHMALPLGEAGIKRLPEEEQVVAGLQKHVRDPGFYILPTIPANANAEQQQQWQQRYRSGPNAILVYHPDGVEPMSPRLLIVELLSNVLVAAVAAWLLAQTALRTYGRRVLFVTALGLLAWLALEISYWNWYRFPGSYTLAASAHELIGFAAAGLVIARMVRAPQPV